LGQAITGHPNPNDFMAVLQGSGENGKSAMGGRGSLNHDPLQAGLQTDRAHRQKYGVRSGEPGGHGRGVIQANADGLQIRAVAEEQLGFPRIAHEHAHRSVGYDQPPDDRAADPPVAPITVLVKKDPPKRLGPGVSFPRGPRRV
jgi:hypothetical protein